MNTAVCFHIFISIQKRCFPTYKSGTLASVNNSYVGQVPDDGHADLLGEPMEKYATYKEVKYG